MKTTTDLINEGIAADRRRDFWYKEGEATFNPSLPLMREPNAIEDYILSGWMPDEPFVCPATRVTFIGCCFGQALLDHLEVADFGESSRLDYVFTPISEALSTTFAMRQLFEWQFEDIKPDIAALKGNRAMEINFTEALWKGSLDRLANTDVFVLMISTAEVWYDKPTGAVTWRETPGANPERQSFRTSSAEENRKNIRTIYDIVRKHRPDAKIILILSPIPMSATYRPQSTITATSVAKAAIRVAIDEVWREVAEEGYLFYWPFYEVILEGFGATPYGGHYTGDRRHINDVALSYMLLQFEKYYCKVRSLSRPVLSAYVAAKVSAADLPEELITAVDNADRRAIQKLIDHYESIDDGPTADLIVAYAVERLNGVLPDSAASDEGRALTWKTCPQIWFEHGSQSPKGAAPRTLVLSTAAWAYGAYCEPIRSNDGSDLVVRLRLQVLEGKVGVILARLDGSSLTGLDKAVSPEQGVVEVELPYYNDDGPAQIILRNYDSAGIAVKVRIDDLSVRVRTIAIPVRSGT